MPSVPLPAGSSRRGISAGRFIVGGVPGLSDERLDGWQFFLLQQFVDARQILGGKTVEFSRDIAKFFLQRIDAGNLIVAGPALVIQNIAVELGGLLANADFS